MEDGVVLHYPDGSCFLGCVEITDSELIFFSKSEKGIYKSISMKSTSMVSGIYNGLIRDAKSITERRDNIRINEIFEAKKERFRLNKNAYYVTLNDGNKYIMIFDHPNSTIEYLESLISKSAN